ASTTSGGAWRNTSRSGGKSLRFRRRNFENGWQFAWRLSSRASRISTTTAKRCSGGSPAASALPYDGWRLRNRQTRPIRLSSENAWRVFPCWRGATRLPPHHRSSRERIELGHLGLRSTHCARLLVSVPPIGSQRTTDCHRGAATCLTISM